MTRVLETALVLALMGAPAAAQVLPDREPVVEATRRDTRAFVAPAAGTASTSLTVDSENGGDLFDVVSSDPAVAISLVLPGGLEISSTNAEAQGFTFAVISGLPGDQILSASPLGRPGTHTLITLPPGSPSGVYQVRANASTATTDTLVIASYFAASSVRGGVLTDSPAYRVGDTVLLTGAILDATMGVLGASVIARIGLPGDIVTPPAEVTLQDFGTFAIDLATASTRANSRQTWPEPLPSRSGRRDCRLVAFRFRGPPPRRFECYHKRPPSRRSLMPASTTI